MRTVQCGTPSGYTTHRAAGERACLPCCDAHRDSSADYRVRSGRTTHAKVLYATLGLLLIWVPDHVLRQAEEEMGKPMVQRAIDARHRARRP